MRRRDVVFVCVACGALLAGLVWALSTQARWVRENKPIQMQRPPRGTEESEPAPTSATGVVGTVDDDTRAAMAKGLASRKPQGTGSGPPPSPPPSFRGTAPKKPQAPPG